MEVSLETDAAVVLASPQQLLLLRTHESRSPPTRLLHATVQPTPRGILWRLSRTLLMAPGIRDIDASHDIAHLLHPISGSSTLEHFAVHLEPSKP